MNKKIPKPSIIVALVGAIVLVLGKFMGWFTLESETVNALVGGLFEDELGSRESVALGVGVIGLLITVGAWQLKKWWMPIITIPMSLFALLMIFNQMPDEADKALLSISIGIGYWMSLAGAILLTAGSIWAIIQLRGQAKIDKASMPSTHAPMAPAAGPATPPMGGLNPSAPVTSTQTTPAPSDPMSAPMSSSPQMPINSPAPMDSQPMSPPSVPGMDDAPTSSVIADAPSMEPAPVDDEPPAFPSEPVGPMPSEPVMPEAPSSDAPTPAFDTPAETPTPAPNDQNPQPPIQ